MHMHINMIHDTFLKRRIARLFLKKVVCYTAVFSVVTQRFSPLGVLRDDTKNGCVADYIKGPRTEL